VLSVTPGGPSYRSFVTPAFTVTAGAHTLTFQGLAAGDTTAFIDAVAASPVTLEPVGDAGFETPILGIGGYMYNPGGAPWAFAGPTGIAANGSPFTGPGPAGSHTTGNGPAPEGVQVAFLQVATSSISQSITGWVPGTYQLSFYAAERENYNAAAPQGILVEIDGMAVLTVTPAGPSYESFLTPLFTVAVGTHSIAFQGLTPGDTTAFLDAVTVTQVS
jgi:hypothetical protein